MTTAVVRVPVRVQQEAQVAARVTGRTVGEILAEAWQVFTDSPQFESALSESQKALATGDISVVTDLMIAQSARAKASAIRRSDL